MVEFLKSLLEASRDRLKSPVLGTYSLSFILFNWRPILFLIFSSASIEDKIVVVNHEYCSVGAILWPLVMTVFITFGVPYFMLLVDIGLAKSKNFRRKIRHDEKVIGLDDEIIVATKEFEIQNRKSGTKTIESLQDTISILEKEKQSLVDLSNAEREKNINEISKVNELLKSEIEKNNFKNKENSLEFSEQVFEMYNNLQHSGQLDEFYTYFDGFTRSLNLSDNTIKFYKNLGLAKFDDGNKYTDLGYELYHFLFEINNSRDVKKRMLGIIEKLNNHETQFFKNLLSDESNIFQLNEGLRTSIVNEIRQANLILKVNDNTYVLTKEGLEFRNLLALNSIDF